MDYTQYHQLSLWDEDDRILMEDFNSDHAKIDAAMAGFGNCAIYTTTYTGTGQYGQEHPVSVTCPGKPLVVLVQGSNEVLLAINPFSSSCSIGSADAKGASFRWDGSTVSWSSSHDTTSHMNIYNLEYRVVAFIAADE